MFRSKTSGGRLNGDREQNDGGINENEIHKLSDSLDYRRVEIVRTKSRLEFKQKSRFRTPNKVCYEQEEDLEQNNEISLEYRPISYCSVPDLIDLIDPNKYTAEPSVMKQRSRSLDNIAIDCNLSNDDVSRSLETDLKKKMICHIMAQKQFLVSRTIAIAIEQSTVAYQIYWMV